METAAGDLPLSAIELEVESEAEPSGETGSRLRSGITNKLLALILIMVWVIWNEALFAVCWELNRKQ